MDLNKYERRDSSHMVDFGPYGRRSSIRNDRTAEPVMLERSEVSNTRTCHPEQVKRRGISINAKEEIPHTRFGMTEPQGAASLVNVYCLILLVTSAVRVAVVTRSTGEFCFYIHRTHRRTIPCLVDIWRSSGCLQSR